MLTDFQNFIHSLAHVLGLPPDNSDFSCKQWSFDGRVVTLRYDADSDDLVMRCMVMQLSRDTALEDIKEALKGNYAFTRTGGAILTVEDDNTLYLNVGYPLHRLDYTAAEQLLTNFLDVADYWQEHLTMHTAATAAPAGWEMLNNLQFRI